MKLLLVLIAGISLSGCAAWDKMGDEEKKAWIISGALVVSAVIIADALDSDVSLTVDQCFAQRSLKTDCIGH